MKMHWTALALALSVPAAYSQTAAPVKHHAKPAHAANLQSRAQIKTLRAEIARDKNDLSTAHKNAKAERVSTMNQWKEELGKLLSAASPRGEKRQARKNLRAKYVAVLKEAREKRVHAGGLLREDIADKRRQIQRLRQS